MTKIDPETTLYGVLLSIILVCTGFLMLSAYGVLSRPAPPRLAGIGCFGTPEGAVIYANEEDEFPLCDQIVANETK